MIYSKGICIVKDKWGRALLKGTERKGLYEVNGANKDDTQRDKSEAVQTLLCCNVIICLNQRTSQFRYNTRKS